MGILLLISLIVIVAIGLTNRKEVLLSIRSGPLVLKIGVFSLVTGIIFHVFGTILGLNELGIINQIISICYMVTFLCLILGVLKFIRLTSFSLNRKVGIFCLITGFAFSVVFEYLPFLESILLGNFNYKIITFIFYFTAVFTLVIEVYNLIFKNHSTGSEKKKNAS